MKGQRKAHHDLNSASIWPAELKEALLLFYGPIISTKWTTYIEDKNVCLWQISFLLIQDEMSDQMVDGILLVNIIQIHLHVTFTK